MQIGAVLRPHVEGRQAERTQEGQTAASQNSAGQQRRRDSEPAWSRGRSETGSRHQATPGSGGAGSTHEEGALASRAWAPERAADRSQGSWPLHLSVLHLPSQRNHKAPFLGFS